MNKLNILLVISSSRKRKDMHAPLYCRLTYLKVRYQFSTGLFVNPKHWNSKKQKVLDDTEQSDYQNKQLSLIISKINQAFLLLQIQETSFDVNDIYSQYKGEKLEKDYTILEAYDKHNEMVKKLIGIDLNKVSWSRYIESRRKVKAFIKATYKKPDIKLKSLDVKFIMGLEYYMKTELKLSQSTINKSLQRVGKVIKFSIAQNYITTDPFLLFKPKKFRQEVVFLNSE